MTEGIRARLFEMQDADYRAFHAGLMPTVDPEKIIGVRVPMLRAYARELAGTPAAAQFLAELPHRYYEEDNLHAFLLEFAKDYDGCIAALDAFLPHVDNWATCDMMFPRVLKRNLPRTRENALRWMESGRCYTVRYGIGVLMRCFLGENFDAACMEAVASVKSGEYYVKMMVAWYFATALALRYDMAVQYIEQRRLEPWVHNKAIQKAVESRRISPERKQYLKKQRISPRK